MFALYNLTKGTAQMHAAYKYLKINIFGKKTNSRKLHMYGEKCYKNAENHGLFTDIHVVFF